jgi:V-type H+-transporting ATPase subunit H
LVEATLLAQLCALLRRVKKEKVVRLAVATLRAVHAEDRAADLLLAYEAPKALALVAAKNKQEWGDEDLTEDVEALSAALEKHVDALSSFDRYAFELAAGQLEWSPVHKSERFWQENAIKFELQDGHSLKALKAMLSSPQSSARTLAVAAWDVGEFARFHPRGKQIVSALELKLPIMKLLNHADEAVSREALLALQKMLVTNWEYLAQK